MAKLGAARGDATGIAGADAAFWTLAPGIAEIRAQAVAEPAADEVRVRTLYTALSRGTESIVFRGEVPRTEYERMRAPFQDGDFPGPVKYGYSSVGLVEAGPPELMGRTVFCLHPHQTRYCVPRTAVHVVPDDVPPARAVLAANMETAVNATWDLAPRTGDRIAVVGGGVVGLLVGWLAAQVPGTRVELVDVESTRAGVAAALGLQFALPDQASGDADRVVHASGRGEGLVTALALAGFEARVLELSWYGSRAVSLPLGGAFHARRLALCSSQVGTIAASQRARWSHARRLALALSLLADARLDRLITGESPFVELPQVLQRLATTASPGTLCHRIRYEEPADVHRQRP